MIWLLNILALCVRDEYYSRNASCALNLIATVSIDIFSSVRIVIFVYMFLSTQEIAPQTEADGPVVNRTISLPPNMEENHYTSTHDLIPKEDNNQVSALN